MDENFTAMIDDFVLRHLQTRVKIHSEKSIIYWPESLSQCYRKSFPDQQDIK